MTGAAGRQGFEHDRVDSARRPGSPRLQRRFPCRGRQPPSVDDGEAAETRGPGDPGGLPLRGNLRPRRHGDRLRDREHDGRPGDLDRRRREAPARPAGCEPPGGVRLAACNMNGRRILGDWEEGTGRIVQDEARYREALAALRRKYGWQLSLARLINRLRGVDRDRVVLELTPSLVVQTSPTT